MTHAHKLARSLALVRQLLAHFGMFPVLLLMAACSAGVPTGVDSALNPADAQVVVNPRSLILEANQSSVFKAYATGVPGDSLVTSIEWTATGGNISLNGTYSSPSTGDFKVVGKRHGPNRTTSDTATVTVVPPQPSITAVVVSPSPAAVTAKTQQTFSAIGKLSDGSTVPIGVTWTATGGSIDAGGIYTAGPTPGTYRAIATAASAPVADTVPITVLSAPVPSSPSGSYPHQPSGLATLYEWGCSGLWSDVSGVHQSSGYGILAGQVWRYPSSAAAANDNSAPQSPAGVCSYTWPAGLPAGTSAGIWFVAWQDASLRQVSHWYESTRVKILGPSIEMQTGTSPAGMKLFGLVGAGQTGAANNQIILGANTTGPNPTTALQIHISQQNVVARHMYPNVNTSALLTVGQWHQIEWLFDLNDVGVANGRAQVWIDGVKVIDYGDVVWRTTTYPAGFFIRKWDPTWGGGGTTPKQQTDVMYLDHIYGAGN